MNNQLLWYVARSSGLVAWGLLAASVLAGLVSSARIVRPTRPFQAMHRYLGGLSLVFVAVHVTTIVLDTYVPFGIAAVFVPFASEWHPLAVAFGIVAVDLLVAIAVTSAFVAYLPSRLWTAVHSLSAVAYLFATVHLFTSGTDATNRAVIVVALATSVAVAFLTAVRIVQAAERRRMRAPVRG